MEAAWSAVSQEHMESLFESMPRRVAVVISNNDGYSVYVYWWISKGTKPNEEGVRLHYEDGSDSPLKEYKNKTMIMTLPDGHSVFEYNFLANWSPSESEDFGSAEIPRDLNIPPSPRTLNLVVDVETRKLNANVQGFGLTTTCDGLLSVILNRFATLLEEKLFLIEKEIVSMNYPIYIG
ncbi:hypothetical protein TNCV_497821 [Trichonephila clavipes]|nr:hypothetical protein TNCV_497821 [Trichonephila clavipes]